jgi:hypothetical protein
MQETQLSEGDRQGGEELLQKVLARSATDMDFRQKLVADSRAALAEFTGADPAKVPATYNIVFVENKAGATIVLPDPIDPAAELSGQDLETVAGGFTPVTIAASLGLAAAATACWNTWKRWG